MKHRLYLLLCLAALPACNGEDVPQRECTLDEDCEGDQKCTEDGQCIEGVECTRDDQCASVDPRRGCDQETNTCVPVEPFADECDTNRPCPFGQFCSELMGRCFDSSTSKDCARRAQCPAGQICDRSANKCIENPGCYGDQFCEEGEICDLVSRNCTSVSIECVACESDGSCPGAATCLPDTQECLEAGVESLCRSGEFCDVLGRCVQCQNDNDCGPGLFCNLSLGRCESNVQCVEDQGECPQNVNVTCVTCESPEICDARTKRCQAPPTECENDLDCAESDFCDLSLPVPICTPRIPDCLNDLLEPNDSLIGARTIGPNEGPRFDELKVCPGDEDWYRIDLEAGTFLTVDARFRHGDGDIELQLLLPDGVTLLDESRSSTDNERVELDVGTDLTVYVRAFLAVPSLVPPQYQLVVNRDPGELCADDGNEEDDELGLAKDLASDTPYSGRLCQADPDWFIVRNVPLGTEITAQLDFADALGDLDLELYRAGSSSPLRAARSTTDGETIVYDASFTGDYFFRVFGKSADSNVYTFRVDLRATGNRECTDDVNEPNNNANEATVPVLPLLDSSLSICTGDEDWYEVSMDIGDTLRAEIGFEPSADLELKLYAPGTDAQTSSPIAASLGTSTREFIAYQTFVPGDFRLRVQGLDQAQRSPYELSLQNDPIAACVPDAIDAIAPGNNTQADAFDLGVAPTRRDDVTICDGDEDWYRIFLNAGFTHILRIHFVNATATLDMSIHDTNGGMLGETAGAATDFKEFAINVPGEVGVAILWLRVFRTSGFETPYSIVSDVTPLFTCELDRFEPNNQLTIATTTTASAAAAPFVFDDLTLCPSFQDFITMEGDVDWFQLLPPAAGTRMDARIDHEQGDLFMELFSPGGAVRACTNIGPDRCFSDGNGLSEMISFTATVSAPYYLKVSSIYSDPSVVVRPPDADTRYRLEVDYTP